MEFHSLPNFFLLLFFSILFLSSSLSHAKVKFNYCDEKEHYAVKVSRIKTSPDHLVTGTPATIKLSASSGKRISGGEVVIGVSYFGTNIDTERIDLCKIVTCPVANGKFLLSHTLKSALTIAPGPHEMNLTLTNDTNELLTCIRFNLQVDVGDI